jgi:chemotaxis protein MotB
MNRLNSTLAIMAVVVLFMSSCVSKKKYNRMETAKTDMEIKFKSCEEELALLRGQGDSLRGKVTDLTRENEFLKQNQTTVLSQLENLNVLSKSQAESVKASLDRLGERDLYIRDLQSAIARKDSLNMALIMNLKGALADVNDEDVQIKVDKGVVYISISDKMLFSSGSANVTQAARSVLGKVATVLNSKPDIEFIVEGHTDTVPISTECVQDNWDLSVKRATAVARILQRDYKMDPKRITAAGRSSYVPVASNADASGRSLNRRTRIVIQPMLDQFFKLLEPGQQPQPETK